MLSQANANIPGRLFKYYAETNFQ